MMGALPALPDLKREGPTNDVSSWYKSLTRSSSAPATEAKPAMSAPSSGIPSGSSTPSMSDVVGTSIRKQQTRDKNSWFISRALQSQPASGRSTPTTTLADILDRELPHDSSDRPFRPPVFLAIGPSNRGFAMLQQSGWSEGEPLGAGEERIPADMEAREIKPEERRIVVKEETREVTLDSDDEITEVQKVNVIDLTFSDSDESGDHDVEPDAAAVESALSSPQPPDPQPGPSASHNPRALLTPLPTVLKSDRLGIGLKAKTEGPYRASKKRVTHGAAALAAHARATEEVRRMKARVGRGTKGFTRLAKAETERRQRLLASLKGD
ncbi:hypothetical protein OBBRIDRAFT_731835 [Obba rivulosa]|uniref:G-patch domain-containing protein n=1 Tax=Obba rivulosa TaxID=1052685 RepID=A0A8E2AS10_9APHY|nr:hypothetical protein OBBRIDRAFT_731835 [Obba rivulosa]